jgi:phosphoribosylglycinamide formyltransferase-1
VSGPAIGRRIVVLASGGGRSLDNLARLAAAQRFSGELAALVCDRSQAGVLEVAARHGIPTRVLRPKDHASPQDHSRAVFACAEEAGARLVVMAGFLRHLLVPSTWLGHVLNIHPSLLPRHGGAGCYGDRVHAAVLAAGDRESGCTVHYVDNLYDNGPHVLVARVPVEPGDDVHSLAARVFAAECEALPRAIELHLSGAVDFATALRRGARPS